jgi:hypothetical protein
MPRGGSRTYLTPFLEVAGSGGLGEDVEMRPSQVPSPAEEWSEIMKTLEDFTSADIEKIALFRFQNGWSEAWTAIKARMSREMVCDIENAILDAVRRNEAGIEQLSKPSLKAIRGVLKEKQPISDNLTDWDKKDSRPSLQFDVAIDHKTFPTLWEFLGRQYFFSQELKDVDKKAIDTLTIKICFKKGRAPSPLLLFPKGTPEADRYFPNRKEDRQRKTREQERKRHEQR